VRQPLPPVLTALLLFALAGCGTHGMQRQAGTQRQAALHPGLPRPLALRLSRESGTVARLLDSRKGCLALRTSHRLQRETIDAINRGRVPGALQEQLQSTVNEVTAGIHCGTSDAGSAARARSLSAWLLRYSR
jgi:hypothetical protein